jgi:hypothetical protein
MLKWLRKKVFCFLWMASCAQLMGWSFMSEASTVGSTATEWVAASYISSLKI